MSLAHATPYLWVPHGNKQKSSKVAYVCLNKTRVARFYFSFTFLSDILTAMWVLGLIFEEMKEFYRQGRERYFAQWWNIITILMLLFFLLAGLFWLLGSSALMVKDGNYSFKYLVRSISRDSAFRFLFISNRWVKNCGEVWKDCNACKFTHRRHCVQPWRHSVITNNTVFSNFLIKSL